MSAEPISVELIGGPLDGRMFQAPDGPLEFHFPSGAKPHDLAPEESRWPTDWRPPLVYRAQGTKLLGGRGARIHRYVLISSDASGNLPV